MDQHITFKRERNNNFDQYAVAGFAKLPGTLAPSIVGHIPLELSRYIWFSIKEGAKITEKVINEIQMFSSITKRTRNTY